MSCRKAGGIAFCLFALVAAATRALVGPVVNESMVP